MIPVVGIIIGIISAVASRRKHTEQTQNASTESVSTGSDEEHGPWLNNGFVVGLVAGLAGGLGFSSAYIAIVVLSATLPTSGAPDNGSCIAPLAGVLLGGFLGYVANKTMVGRGLDSLTSTHRGTFRLVLAIIGAIVGFFVGFSCLGAALSIPILLGTMGS
jgi:hypothetical protein